MSSNLAKFLGDGQYPFPLEAFCLINEIAFNNKMYVGITRQSIDFSEGIHAHSSYEFLIPFTNMPTTWVERRKLNFEKNKLTPFNSWQAHGPANACSGCRLISFQIDSEYLNEISGSIYGKKQVEFYNDNYKVDSGLQELLYRFMQEFKSRQAGYEFILDSLSMQIVVALLRSIKYNMRGDLNAMLYKEKDNIKRAIDFLTENFSGEYSLEELAGVANLSPFHFIRAFKAKTGKTPYDYLLELKIDKAKEMLKLVDQTITEICFACGFNNSNHFTSVFKRKIGVTPSEYRKNIV